MIGFVSNFDKLFETCIEIHDVKAIQKSIILIPHKAVILRSIKYHKIYIV
jgi:hypothetical protein